jgi:exonuclease III
MTMLVWNVRGLNHPSKQKEVQRLVRAKRFGLVCLIETKVKEDNAASISSFIFSDWDFCYNYDKHYLGRIWVCWNRDDFQVSVVTKSA